MKELTLRAWDEVRASEAFARLRPTAVLLCGSAARGDFIPQWSDIDIVLVWMTNAVGDESKIPLLQKRLQEHLKCETSVRLIVIERLRQALNELLTKENTDPPTLPFGFAKCTEAWLRAGQDSRVLEGSPPVLKLNANQQSCVYASGIRDTIEAMSRLDVKQVSTGSLYLAKKSLGQLVNGCRMVLRFEGWEFELSHITVASLVTQVPYVPSEVIRVMEDYEGWRRLAARGNLGARDIRAIAHDAVTAHRLLCERTMERFASTKLKPTLVFRHNPRQEFWVRGVRPGSEAQAPS